MTTISHSKFKNWNYLLMNKVHFINEYFIILEKIARIQNIKIEALKQEFDSLFSENTMKETLISEMESKGRNIVD